MCETFCEKDRFVPFKVRVSFINVCSHGCLQNLALLRRWALLNSKVCKGHIRIQWTFLFQFKQFVDVCVLLSVKRDIVDTFRKALILKLGYHRAVEQERFQVINLWSGPTNTSVGYSMKRAYVRYDRHPEEFWASGWTFSTWTNCFFP